MIKLKIDTHFKNIGNRRSIRISSSGVEEIGKYFDANEVVKNANIAISQYNEEDSACIYYDDFMKFRLDRLEKIEDELINGIINPKSENLYLKFQPIVSTKDSKVIAFEALVRLNSKTTGIVSPAEFVPVAESTGLIISLREWIYREAIDFLKELEYLNYSNLKISINVYSLQFNDVSFIDKLLSYIEKKNVNPQNVVIEIVESTIVEDYNYVNKCLKKLKLAGVKVAIDDFGTGHSSLARLRELNIDTIKIDKL